MAPVVTAHEAVHNQVEVDGLAALHHGEHHLANLVPAEAHACHVIDDALQRNVF